MRSHYSILGVAAGVEFADLRKAYRTRAMECHPDRFEGDPSKAEEFKRLVEAFNVLSDPLKRRSYDAELGVPVDGKDESAPLFEMGFDPEDERAILDTLADDILEELIVGNVVPKGATLQTLMLDLEGTEQFCLFREAKTYLYNGSTIMAERLFKRYLRMSSVNILARYYLSRCCKLNGRWREAQRHLAVAIKIGSTRRPPLRLIRLRRELSQLQVEEPGIRGFLRRLFQDGSPAVDTTPADVSERRALNRAINRLARAGSGSKKKLAPKRDRP